jgi:hypothetical protein
MPDGIQPVGAMIQPPDLNKGISTLSGMLGLRQQQQSLQTGQQQLQQEQLKTAEAQGVQNFFQTWDPSQHIAEDGSTDLDSALQSKEFKAAGNAKPAIMKYLLDIKDKQLSNKQSLSSLNKDLVTQFGTAMGALAKDDDVVADKTDPTTGVNAGRAKVDQFLGNFSKLSPDAARVAQIYGPITQHAPPGKLSHGVSALQLQAQSASEQQTQQNPQQYAVNTGGATNVYNVDRSIGLQPGQQPAQSIKATLGPTEQLPYRRAAAAAGTEGAQGAANDEALYNDIVQKGTKAVQLKALTQDIRNLSSEVQTGQYSKALSDKWSALKQTFGFRPDDDSFETKRQILSKMAAQLRTQSEAGASTDSERNGIAAALPDPEHMGPAAVSQAARYVGALADTNAARARFANQHRQVNGGKSTGIREADSAFMQNADPRVFEYQSIPAGQERQNYLKQHFKSKEEIKAFLDKQQALRGYGAIQ